MKPPLGQLGDSSQSTKARLRRRLYGRCRARGWNRFAWLFADGHGRKTLRELRQIRRVK